MFSLLRNRFGIPGIVSVIALVFAMSGGAFAAQHYLAGASSAKQAKRGPRGPQGLQGQNGLQGPIGPAGPNGARGETGARGGEGELGPQGAIGATGPQGPIGNQGSQGSAGSQGAPGAAGKSVVSTSFDGAGEPAGNPCEEHGGTEFEVESSGVVHYVCNGSGGGAALPEVMTGTWSIGKVPFGAAGDPIFVSISYPFPLATAPGNVGYIQATGAEPSAICPGTAANPEPASGHLCLYAQEEVNWTIPLEGFGLLLHVPAANDLGANKQIGDVLKGETSGSGAAQAYGTWAVRP
jgi:hypothetical protein